MFKLITLAVALAAVATGAPTATSEVGPHLDQIRRFSAVEGEKVWPGYGSAPFGFLLVTENRETLLCRDQVPDGFAAAGTDQATACRRYTRKPSGLPSNLLAAIPIFGSPSVMVMGTPQSTGRSEANWVRTILHEHFHQWQNALPDYYARTAALDLAGEDETGMWMLNYAFPYDDPQVVAVFNRASRALADAVAARGTPTFLSAFDKYLAARQALAARAGDRDWRYLEFQLWQEGVARWTEIRLGKWYPRQDVRDSAASLEQATMDALKTPKLPEMKREVVYAHGAAEAMLLQACGHGWRAEYPKVLALGPLLEAARRHCRAIG